VVTKGDVLNGRYRLLSLEGEGGMADVYKAQDLTLDRTVAIKILRPEYDAGDAFEREARAIAKLPHPNIVTVHDVCQDEGSRYIVMEYAEGESLRELLQPEAPFRPARALDIAVQVCDALGFAHEKGILHCDVKPHNILVQQDGKVKVTDFGIARALQPDVPGQEGKLWGTPYYAAPELLLGNKLTPASDVYSVGVLLYEMLCGRRPFEGQSAAEIGRQHVLNAPPPIEQYNPRIPRYLRQVIDRALAKDPALRYRNAAELGKALRAYRQHGASATQPLEPIQVAGAALSGTRSSPVILSPSLDEAQPAERQRRADWVMLLLAGLAFLSVMGLLPLWGTILTRALTPPPPVSESVTPGPVLVPTSTQDLSSIDTPRVEAATPQPDVAVPPLVGEELETARQLARDVRLGLAIASQQHSSDVPVSHVIEQSPEPGTEVAPGTQIAVTVSLGPEMVVVPDVVGFPVAVKQLDLEDIGLIVSVTRTWSLEPKDLIISQTLEAGTTITIGQTITLTVSSGPEGEVRANFADKVLLASCEFADVVVRPGGALQLLITWQVEDRLGEDYTVFVHIVDRDGHILTQRDLPPLGGSRPTSAWQPGERLLDSYVLTIPSDAPEADYWVYVGLYRGDFRLPVTDPGFAETKGNAVILRQIRVEK
jgi:serine/threonine protein kinase